MKKFRTIAAAAAMVLTALGLGACSSATPLTAACAMVIGNGGSEAHVVKKVALPGESIGKQGDDWIRYVPCGFRNWGVTPQGSDHGDTHIPVTGVTKPGPNGEPGVQINGYVTMNWTPNELFKPPTGSATGGSGPMAEFWVMCQKFTCAVDDQGDLSKGPNSSPPNWHAMLAEVMGPAVQRSFADAARTMPQDLYWNQADWPDLVTAFEANILAEERSSTKTASDMFCDPASPAGTCAPPSLTIESIAPVDANLLTIRQNLVTQDQSASANAARIANAKQLYGPDWYKVLAAQDEMDKCKALALTCNVNIGNGVPVFAAN